MARDPRLTVSSRCRPNLRAVTYEVLDRFPEVRQIWTYGLGPDHDNERCTDFMSYRDTRLGQRIADYLERNADRLGVLYIIWNRRIWRRHANANGPARTWTTYRGPNSHVDHVHMEVSDKTYDPPAATAPAKDSEDDMPEPKDVWTADVIPNVDSQGRAIFTGNAKNETVTAATALVEIQRDLSALRSELADLRTVVAVVTGRPPAPPKP